MPFITTQYSLWFLPLCIAAGFAFAFFLYRKETKLYEAPKLVKILMFTLRFLSVSIIAFLLLKPVINRIGKTIEKPVIIYLQDNSESLKKYAGDIYKIQNSLSDYFKDNNNYKFRTFAFGEEIQETDTFNFSAKETDISSALNKIKNKFYNRNIGAVILASDGIYNRGRNPVYETENTDFPIYTVVPGDTTLHKDLIITEIKYNKTAFLNTRFPLRVKIKADKMKGKNSRIKIYDNKKLIIDKPFNINDDKFYKTFEFKIKADKTGFHKIKISVPASEEEISDKNNSQKIIVEVNDKKQKVLILSDAPHPDIAAIKESLGQNQNIETEYFDINKFNGTTGGYDLVILNQLPSKYNSASNILNKIKKNEIPVIYILGNNSSLEKFDNLNTGLTTGAYSNAPDEVTGKLNKNFDLFDINPETEILTLNAPPLLSPFGDYKFSARGKILFYRKIKNIETKQPLIIFFSGGGLKKSAVIAGEGIWRWRIFDYKTNKNHYIFNEFINDMVQFLISGNSKNELEIIAEKIIPENRNITIKAETYDKNFSPVEVENIFFSISDSVGKSKNYKFEKHGQKYILNIGKLPAGDYRWKAETVINGKKIKKEGLFSVTELQTEFSDLRAKPQILYRISRNTKAKMFFAEDISGLFDAVKNNDNIKPVSYSEKKSRDLTDFKPVFFIILFLLTTEWFLRKFYGTY